MTEQRVSSMGGVEITKADMNIVQVEGVLTDPEPIVDLPELPVLSPDEQRRLWRKVDKRILPILSVMYLCFYLDRGTVFYTLHSPTHC